MVLGECMSLWVWGGKCPISSSSHSHELFTCVAGGLKEWIRKNLISAQGTASVDLWCHSITWLKGRCLTEWKENWKNFNWWKKATFNFYTCQSNCALSRCSGRLPSFVQCSIKLSIDRFFYSVSPGCGQVRLVRNGNRLLSIPLLFLPDFARQSESDVRTP